jgi:hypothetical protein
MLDLTALLLRHLPCRPSICEQLLDTHRVGSTLRKLRNIPCIICQARQIRLGQSTIVPPSLHRRRSQLHPFSEAGEADMLNRFCNGAHLCQSVHQLCKVTPDRKCKHSAADSAGGRRRHPCQLLGSPRISQPGCGASLWAIGYRAGARSLAWCHSEMARRRKPAEAYKHDCPGAQSRRQSRMAMDWAWA